MTAPTTYRRRVKLWDGNRTTDATVEISAPISVAETRRFYCVVHFPHIMGDPIRVAGEDEIEALTRALGVIRDLVVRHKGIGWRVSWLTDGDDGGFW
ncbi:MAG TPA: hypothetical protein VFT55_10700 [Planctomycetota bacterium]|nr:hypothetical protein [Planctomycetota bacterium]